MMRISERESGSFSKVKTTEFRKLEMEVVVLTWWMKIQILLYWIS